MIKVAEINAYNIGSTGKIMLQIAELAKEKEIQITTFSSSRESKKPETDSHHFIDRYLDYRIHMAIGMVFGFELEFSYFATKKLIGILNEIKPDIIHIHNTHGWYLNHSLFFRYIKKQNLKVIWTLHDCWSFTGRCPHFQITKCERWKTGCYSCTYDKKLYPASYFFDRCQRNWEKKQKLFTGIKDLTIVTPSHWLKHLVKQSFLNEYPVKVIHNGIDLDVFKQTECDFKHEYRCQDKYIVLGVAFSWGRRKGLDVFIELSKRLGKKYQIVLVGTNKTIDKILPENIISIHKTNNQQELAQIYSTADVFVNPTREDNFPTVNIEALACGTPVVTFKTGGSPESLDESCGCVVECEDISSLEQEIKRICEKQIFNRGDCIRRAKQFDRNDKYMEYIALYYEKGMK